MELQRKLTPSMWIALAIIALSIPLHIAVKNTQWLDDVDPLPPGEKAPDFTIREPDGRLWSMAGFQGKVVLLSFCNLKDAICRYQATSLNAFVKNFGDRGLEVIFLAKDPTPEQMKKIEDNNKPEFFVFQDPGGTVAKKYFVNTTPYNFLIDREGYIVKGFNERVRYNSRDLRKLIESLLETP